MCAIVDANVAGEIFSPNDRPEAGVKFFEWIDTGILRFVAGGKLLEELNKTPAAPWIEAARRAGKMKIFDKEKVDKCAEQLKKDNLCKSDDPHILALAKVSGARLLYSNDSNLRKDFKNKDLVDNPRGKIYSTNRNQDFSKKHRGLLKDKSLCRTRS